MSLYTDSTDGLPGNDDCGQMSAWYVFSALGFYPVAPGQNVYAIGTPLFDKAVISLGSGKKFEIEADGVSAQAKYIHSAVFNGKKYNRDYLNQADIADGGEIHYVMAVTPDKSWGSDNAGLFAMAPITTSFLWSR